MNRRLWSVSARVGLLLGAAVVAISAHARSAGKNDAETFDIQDPHIQALHDLTYDQKPPRPVPGVDYGIDPETGTFSHPKATPLVQDPPNFEVDYWDQQRNIVWLFSNNAFTRSPARRWDSRFLECPPRRGRRAASGSTGVLRIDT